MLTLSDTEMVYLSLAPVRDAVPVRDAAIPATHKAIIYNKVQELVERLAGTYQ